MENKAAKSKKHRELVRKTKKVQKALATQLTLNITFRHVEPTQALRDHAQHKLAHLGRALKRPSQAHLILGVDKYRQCGEVIFKSGRLTATAVEEGKDLYAVIDLLVDKIGRQLKKHVEKMTAKKMRSPSTAEVLAEAEPGGDQG